MGVAFRFCPLLGLCFCPQAIVLLGVVAKACPGHDRPAGTIDAMRTEFAICES
jgi:hypothetical protein